MTLLEPADLPLRPWLVRELDEWRAAPEREGLSQAVGCCRRLCRSRLGHETLEAVQIEATRLDAELIARRPGEDHVVADRFAELGDVRSQDLRRGGRRTTSPEILDQPVARDGFTRAEKQDREESTRLCCVQPDDAAVGDNLERPKDAEIHCESRART